MSFLPSDGRGKADVGGKSGGGSDIRWRFRYGVPASCEAEDSVSTVGRMSQPGRAVRNASVTRCRAGCESPGFKSPAPKTLIRVVGDVSVPRRTPYCERCRRGVTPMDAWAGRDATRLPPRGRRLVALAGSDRSFDKAIARPQQMCPRKWACGSATGPRAGRANNPAMRPRRISNSRVTRPCRCMKPKGGSNVRWTGRR